jgi:hypothetical protein
LPTRTRKVRGSRTQALVAEAYQRIWPHATSAGGGAAGRDVLNVPLSIEVKGRRAFTPLEWIKQARRSARPVEDEFPAHVVMRPDGVGEASVGDFLVIRRLCDDIDLLEELLLRRGIMRTAGMEHHVEHFRTAGRGDLDDAAWQQRRRELSRPWPYDGAEGRARLTGNLGTAEPDVPGMQELRRKRRELLEYTERNGVMSPAAQEELEDLRAADD